MDLPDIKKARYMVIIASNNNLLLTNEYDVFPSSQGEGLNLYKLYGYFEVDGDKFKWNDKTLSLDEYNFGKIKIEVRQG